MIQRVKGSAFETADDFGYVSLLDKVKADGVTDASVAILEVLNAGKTLYIPVGTFISSPINLPVNSRIIGAGDTAILKLKNGSNLPLLTLGNGTVIQDFKIDGNKVNQTISGSHGVLFLNANTSKAAGITVINCKGDGINVGGTSVSIVVQDCYLSGNTVNGFRVESGEDIVVSNVKAIQSDISATGDGIAIASAGNTVSKIVITGCHSSYNVGRGIAILGFGSKNVIGISLDNCLVNNNTSHGIHIINAEQCSISAGNVSNNGGDGIRIEGDVQYCRVNSVMLRSNTTFALREVTSGAVPNFNGLIYNVPRNNGNDTITKVGASSFIV